MNCKPGDLAVIVVGGGTGHLGKIVTIVRAANLKDFDTYNVRPTENIWVVDRMLGTTQGYSIPLHPDKWLRPIRDPGDDAVDEMVQKLGKPEGVPA